MFKHKNLPETREVDGENRSYFRGDLGAFLGAKSILGALLRALKTPQTTNNLLQPHSLTSCIASKCMIPRDCFL